MGMKWTEDQQQVIDLRETNILVAAAAGSGKTAVLVERIITRLTKDENPLNVDELLIVTFTEAAAAEMKERILKAIEKALVEEPDNLHLQKQATLIHSASITTIHSFCLSVIRDHFHTIDLDPVFRIGEEGELKLLKQDTMDKLLELEYTERRPEYIRFVEALAPGKSDKPIESLILELYEFSRSNPQPEKWLLDCVEYCDISSVSELEESQIGKFMIQDVKRCVEDMLVRTERAIAICSEVDGPYHYEEACTADEVKFQYILNVIQDGVDPNIIEELYREIGSDDWTPLSRKRPKDVDADKKELVKNIRDENKTVMKGLIKKYFYLNPELQIKDLQTSKGLIEELVRLVCAFATMYREEKLSRGIIDFNDMEQYALQILTDSVDGELVPSKVAEEYQDKFAEIMIDEYQDSNLIQEAILTSVSTVAKGRYNVFMVGDVKQSIYRFRLSRPELFMEKFNRYSNEGNEQRIDLSKNFRSRSEVLDCTNYIFYKIMKTFLGGVEYDEKSALYLGADYQGLPEEFYDSRVAAMEEFKVEPMVEVIDNQAELLLIDGEMLEEIEGSEDSVRELEARAVARRIKELVAAQPVYDKELEGYRTAKYSDIVLLTRSLSGWSDVFADVLGQEGIPTSVASGEGYFSTLEIALILDYLRVLDNPMQDIPLAAVLRSMFGDFTDSELAEIKSRFRGQRFCEAVFAYAALNKESGEVYNEILHDKLNKCLAQIQVFRKKVTYLGIHELLWDIFQVTHYRDYIYALPGGEQRRANIDMLLAKATTFESTSYKGIFNFIRYIEQLQKYQMEYGEASITDELDDVVRIMSIHKSKGLEFPIVIIIGMGKEFNKQDARGQLAIHPDSGVGLDAIDPENRTKIVTVMKQAIRRRLELDSLGEELRVLYVAMTRAKEKLIMIGNVSGLKKKKEKLRIDLEVPETQSIGIDFLTLSRARSYLDWVIQCVCYREEAPIRVRSIDIETLVKKEVIEEIQDTLNKGWLKSLDGTEIYEESFRELLMQQFHFQYPYAKEQEFKLKMTVTEIKKQAQMLEDYEQNFVTELIKKTPIEPAFIRKEQVKQTGAYRGTAYHKLMELWDFSKEYSNDLVTEFLAENEEQGKITTDMVQCIDVKDVAIFMGTDLVKRMSRAARNHKFFKEQPFVIGVSSAQIYGVESDEITLVQGIIDVYFEEEDGLVVVDYKTDRVKTMHELKERYHAQLEYYGQALEQLTGKVVKERIIYSFELQDLISM
ncbi:MAG: helicase-exonuclease AddAB subunit AddA [Eubacteriales bacterium]